jgi:hypothetical protein
VLFHTFALQEHICFELVVVVDVDEGHECSHCLAHKEFSTAACPTQYYLYTTTLGDKDKVSTQALTHAKLDSHGRTLDKRITSIISVAVSLLLVPLCLYLLLPELPEMPEQPPALCNWIRQGSLGRLCTHIPQEISTTYLRLFVVVVVVVITIVVSVGVSIVVVVAATTATLFVPVALDFFCALKVKTYYVANQQDVDGGKQGKELYPKPFADSTSESQQTDRHHMKVV